MLAMLLRAPQATAFVAPTAAAVAAQRRPAAIAAPSQRLRASPAAPRTRGPHQRAAALVLAAAAGGGPGNGGGSGSFAARKRQLADPAKLEGASTATVPVQDRGGSLSLDAYMNLPTEQYNELDPSMIESLGGSRFLLRVPRVSLFSVWVEPEVTVDVRLSDGDGGGVIFESGECRLRGSELLQRLELDRRFVLYFHTLLTWQPHGSKGSSTNGSGAANGGGSSSAPNGSPAAAAPAAAPSAALASAGRPPGQGVIKAEARVEVWSEVVGPFRAIPRGVLQGTGSAVVGALMQALLPVFMNKLADDYVRWAGDAAYRARRAAAASASVAAAAGSAAAAAAGSAAAAGAAGGAPRM